MTQEEFYVWLLNHNSSSGFNLPKVNPEFLKNYEIAKIVLEKFSIHRLDKQEQKNLNFEAVSAWFRVSKYIHLQHDIPEILELLPERIIGTLNLQNSKIESLPRLESVGEGLDLQYSKIQSLSQLESVGGSLYLENSKIQSLPQLESVGGFLNLWNSQIQSLPQLKTVGGLLNLQDARIQTLPELEAAGEFIYAKRNKLDYWRRYFNETGRSSLAERVAFI